MMGLEVKCWPKKKILTAGKGGDLLLFGNDDLVQPDGWGVQL